ncbi:MAG TPA: hypothetical protein VMR52_08920 [Dehalococcoidia bacterium]|nr:hypothetical protein [Dehalococcoidia bacterium]
MSVSTWVNTVLKQLLGASIPDETVLGTKDFVNASAYFPDVVACQL